MNRILHILRKDWKLLWALGVACAVLQAMLAFLEYRPESFAASSGNDAAAMILSLSLFVGLVVTILLAVQQDALTGADQDWLVRPIRRRDLLIAKSLFMLLVVHGPIVTVHWLRGVAEGLAPGDMLRAALLGNLELALLFSLPVFALGSLSKTVTEALVTALAALLFVLLSELVVATVSMTVSHSFHFGGSTDDTGVDWIARSLRHAVLILTGLAILGLQYYRRDTRTSRIVLAIGLLLFVIVGRLPWGPAFALQEALSPQPDAARALTLEMAPPSPERAGGFALQASDSKARLKPVGPGQQRLALGILVHGLPPGAVLHADRVALRLVDAGGNTLYRGTAQDWDLRAGDDGAAVVSQVIDVSKQVYARAADQRVTVELDYSLTLLTSRALPGFAALDGNAVLKDVGHCASRLDDEGTGFDVGCDAAGLLPPCLSVSLARGDPLRLDGETFVCDLAYEPTTWHFSIDPIERFMRTLPFRDPAHPPVAGPLGAAGPGAEVVIRLYEAVAHFSRRVRQTEVRTSDLKETSSRS